MASSGLRSSPDCWLLGKPTSCLSTARLPRAIDVLRHLQFHHLEKGETLSDSYKLTCEAVAALWQRARIPTQRIDSSIRKLTKLYGQYKALKKNRTRQNERDRKNEDLFIDELNDLFDIATNDAMTEIKNEEDREFLCKQRENVFSCSMSGADLQTTSKEIRKRQRQEKEKLVKVRYEERQAKVASQFAEAKSEDEHSETSPEEGQDEFRPPTSTAAAPHTVPSTAKRSKNIFKSPAVVSALDRVNLPDRGAVFVAGAIAQSLGHDLSDITLSRSSVRRSRREGRQETASAEILDFSPSGPLLLHWDGKLLPDIDDSSAKVDRIAIIVTGNGQEKLLGIPKMDRGTGESQAQACLDTLHQWNISSQVKGLVFDTTASNTGLHKGACIRIEETLGTELVWIACRHHIMEIMLSHAFSAVFGATTSPEIVLFKRFQKGWASLNHGSYSSASDDLFQDPILCRLRTEMLEYLPNAIKAQQPRDDYKEFLQLSLLFLGGETGSELIRPPGPTHHARWMGKGIYALKMFLFRDQFRLTPAEKKKITELSLFVSLIYIKYWNEAPLGIRAPYNDIELLFILQSYPNQTIASKAFSAFANHLWFLSEHLVALAFFDDRVTTQTKEKMVENIQQPKLADLPRRPKIANRLASLVIEDLVTERTTYFFDAVMDNGRAVFERLVESKAPGEWTDDSSYEELYQSCKNMTVVNDTAERGVSLIEKYNQTLTKDEEQKQFLVRLVAKHRQQYPTASKKMLMSYNCA